MKAPPRLIDDPAVAPGLREDLERTRRAGPAYDVAVGLAGFQAALGTGAGTGASATATTTTTTTSTSTSATAAVHTAKLAGVLSVKTVVAAVVATAAVATAIAWPSTKPAPARSPSERAAAVAPHAAAPAPAPAPEIPAGGAPVDAPAVPAAVEAAPTPAPQVTARSGERRSAARSDDADSRREIAQLARIKALVDVDPARAYRLAQQGDREFARGMLRQERDALAIIALAHSERGAEAKEHLRAFIARYPSSPAREHLTQLLGAERE